MKIEDALLMLASSNTFKYKNKLMKMMKITGYIIDNVACMTRGKLKLTLSKARTVKKNFLLMFQKSIKFNKTSLFLN